MLKTFHLGSRPPDVQVHFMAHAGSLAALNYGAEGHKLGQVEK